MKRYSIFVIATVLLFLPWRIATATDFKCGKTFITFLHQQGGRGGSSYPSTRITVPKKDILRVFSVVDAPSNMVGAATFVTMKHPVETGGLARAIDEETRRRIIDCLD